MMARSRDILITALHSIYWENIKLFESLSMTNYFLTNVVFLHIV